MHIRKHNMPIVFVAGMFFVAMSAASACSWQHMHSEGFLGWDDEQAQLFVHIMAYMFTMLACFMGYLFVTAVDDDEYTYEWDDQRPTAISQVNDGCTCHRYTGLAITCLVHYPQD